MNESEVRALIEQILQENGVSLSNDGEVPEVTTLDGTEMLFGMRTAGGTPSYFKMLAGAIGIPQTQTVKAVRSLKQAEYDALVAQGAVSATTVYLIV